MNNTYKVSVIIPVYNVASFLKKCITSLINQSYSNCEFIFVNDGSTDNSLEILEEFQTKDYRIKIINQENHGVSIARNNGITISTGMYVGFVDADDWVEVDFYLNLVQAIEHYQCDLVLSNIRNYLNGFAFENTYPFLSNQRLEREYIEQTIFTHLILNDDLYSSCNKLFRRSILTQNNVFFPPGNALSEDNIFNLKYFNFIQSMVYLNYTGYNYREVEGSATRNLVKYNYIENVIAIYNFDYQKLLNFTFSVVELNQLKDRKLIKNVFSLINIYANPKNQLSLFERLRYLKSIINKKVIQSAIFNNSDYFYENENRFNRFLLRSIQEKSVIKLYFATVYSRLRNK
jgi:glycosyltransferase involved in cell wall biosynthesis